MKKLLFYVCVLVVPCLVSAATLLHFQYDLGLGQSDSEVYRLQRLLNATSTTQVATEGPGSPGQETEYYGEKTADAVKRFQAQYEEIIQSGLFNEETRAKMNARIDQMVEEIQATINRILELLALMQKERRTTLTPAEKEELTQLLNTSNTAANTLAQIRTESTSSQIQVISHLFDSQGYIVGYCDVLGDCYIYGSDGSLILLTPEELSGLIANGTLFNSFPTVDINGNNTQTTPTTPNPTISSGASSCASGYCAICTNSENVKFDGDVYIVTVFGQNPDGTTSWINETTNLTTQDIRYEWNYRGKNASETIRRNISSFAVIYNEIDPSNPSIAPSISVTLPGNTILRPECKPPTILSPEMLAELIANGSSTAGAKLEPFRVNCVIDDGSLKETYEVGDRILYDVKVTGADSRQSTKYTWALNFLNITDTTSGSVNSSSINYSDGPFVVQELSSPGTYGAIIIVQNGLTTKDAICPNIQVVEKGWTVPLPSCRIDNTRIVQGQPFSFSVLSTEFQDSYRNIPGNFVYEWKIEGDGQTQRQDNYGSYIQFMKDSGDNWSFGPVFTPLAMLQGVYFASVQVYFDRDGTKDKTKYETVGSEVQCTAANGATTITVIGN